MPEIAHPLGGGLFRSRQAWRLLSFPFCEGCMEVFERTVWLVGLDAVGVEVDHLILAW